MKYVPKSSPEPDSLAHFRIANPDASWDDLKSLAKACYDNIRNVTRSDQGSLCAFCEVVLETDNEQIAHFHPKSDTGNTHNWAIDWLNLWLACKGGAQTHETNPESFLRPLPDNISCDQRKGASVVDDSILAPSDVPLFPCIFRFKQRRNGMDICADEDGCSKAGIPVEKVNKTIGLFNLNCDRLSAARLNVHRPLEQAIAKLRDSGKNPNIGYRSLAERHLAKDRHGRWPRYFTLRRWRLRAGAELYLRNISYQG